MLPCQDSHVCLTSLIAQRKFSSQDIKLLIAYKVSTDETLCFIKYLTAIVGESQDQKGIRQSLSQSWWTKPSL